MTVTWLQQNTWYTIYDKALSLRHQQFTPIVIIEFTEKVFESLQIFRFQNTKC